MKECPGCRIEKPYEAFGADNRKRDGRKTKCRACDAAFFREYRQTNKDNVWVSKVKNYAKKRDVILKQKAAYYARNAEKLKPYKKAWQIANRDKVYAIAKRHRAANPHKGAARRAQYRAAQLMATPAWADLEKIEEFYAAARFLGMVTGEWYEVDHIVPLQSDSVCGLHVHTNLRVITQFDNRSKANRHWPEMP